MTCDSRQETRFVDKKNKMKGLFFFVPFRNHGLVFYSRNCFELNILFSFVNGQTFRGWFRPHYYISNYTLIDHTKLCECKISSDVKNIYLIIYLLIKCWMCWNVGGRLGLIKKLCWNAGEKRKKPRKKEIVIRVC